MQIYLIVNYYNIKTNKFPCLYVGSDSKDRKYYMGSSKSLTKDIQELGIDNFCKIVLWQGSKLELSYLGYQTITELENLYHTVLNVTHKEEFYNKATALGKFNTQGTANFRYLTSKKLVNLPLDHPDVISGLVEGMNKGHSFTISKAALERRKETSMRRYGTPYPTMSPVVQKKLRKPKTESHKNKLRKPKTESHKANMKKPKTESHKANMSLNHKNNTSITQMSIDGTHLKVFDTIKAAAIEVYPNVKYVNARDYISKVCRGLVRSPKDYIWKYTV